jgi:hypothetical protein
MKFLYHILGFVSVIFALATSALAVGSFVRSENNAGIFFLVALLSWGGVVFFGMLASKK